jgi:hypothetical protein
VRFISAKAGPFVSTASGPIRIEPVNVQGREGSAKLVAFDGLTRLHRAMRFAKPAEA